MMIKVSLIILITFLFGSTFQQNGLKISYLGNCGFLFENQSSKVLIDPFGTEYGNYFYLPTPETARNIEESNDPFDDIDLVLITHIHGDHFNPFVAERFLQKNKKVKLICPRQVFEQIKDSCVNFKQIESQIISPQISLNNIETISINNVSITVVRMQHGTDRNLSGIDYNDYTEYEKTENFGYMIDFNHKVIFHQGDACLKINEEAINNLRRKIDITFLSYFDWDSVSYNMLKEKFQSDQIIFMHGTKPGKELDTEQFKPIESKLIFFNRELESKIFE